MFYSEIFIVFFFFVTFSISDPFSVNFCLWCKVGDPTLFFYTWISSYQASFIEKGNFFPIELSWHPCQKSVHHMYKGLSLNSQFHSIDVYVCLYFSTTLCYSLDLLLCVMFWNQEMWILWLCCSVSRLFWLFCIPCISI